MDCGPNGKLKETETLRKDNCLMYKILFISCQDNVLILLR